MQTFDTRFDGIKFTNKQKGNIVIKEGSSNWVI